MRRAALSAGIPDSVPAMTVNRACSSGLEAINLAVMSIVTGESEIVVAGGASVYAAAMPLATEQVISEIPLEPEGDVFYPDFDRHHWKETRREELEGFDRVWLRRR